MGIGIGAGFDLESASPNFSRDQFATLADMKACVTCDDGHISYNKQNGCRYEFKADNTLDSQTGKWRLYKPGPEVWVESSVKNSVRMMDAAEASGHDSVAEGLYTRATAQRAHAEGYQAEANNIQAHAEGKDTRANGEESHAEGDGSVAGGRAAHAEGDNTTAYYYGAHAEGGTSGVKKAISGKVNVAADVAVAARSEQEITFGAEVKVDNAYLTGATLDGLVIILETRVSKTDGVYVSKVKVYNPERSAKTISAGNYDVIIRQSAIGAMSHAEGRDSRAIGHQSHAEGSYTIAANDNSHAEGAYSIATAANSHAEGCQNKATAQQAHAEGAGSTASGEMSHAEGSGTIASGSMSHAEGCQAQATGSGAHAEGYMTKAIQAFTHAEGSGSRAVQYADHAEGNYTLAGGMYSHAEGGNTITAGNYAHAEGYGVDNNIGLSAKVDKEYKISQGSKVDVTLATPIDLQGKTTIGARYGTPIVVSETISYTGGKRLLTKVKLYNNEIYDVTLTTANAYNFVNGCVAAGTGSHAEGYACRAGDFAHAEGYFTAASQVAHAEGYFTNALGWASHAEGSNTIVEAYESHVEGYYNKVDGGTSSGNHAEGYYNRLRSIGSGNHVEGYYNILDSGQANHIEGWNNAAGGQETGMHVEGVQNGAKGYGAHAEGCNSSPYSYSVKVASLVTLDGAYVNMDLTEGIDLVEVGDIVQDNNLRPIASVNSITNTETTKRVQLLVIMSQKYDGEYNTIAAGNLTMKRGGVALQSGAHAEGCSCRALGWASHAEGFRTTARNHGEHAEGVCNISHTGDDLADQTIHSVGRGDYDSATREYTSGNAHEIMKNGDHWMGRARMMKGEYGDEDAFDMIPRVYDTEEALAEFYDEDEACYIIHVDKNCGERTFDFRCMRDNQDLTIGLEVDEVCQNELVIYYPAESIDFRETAYMVRMNEDNADHDLDSIISLQNGVAVFGAMPIPEEDETDTTSLDEA